MAGDTLSHATVSLEAEIAQVEYNLLMSVSMSIQKLHKTPSRLYLSEKMLPSVCASRCYAASPALSCNLHEINSEKITHLNHFDLPNLTNCWQFQKSRQAHIHTYPI